MRTLARILLLIEVVVCFGPMTVMLIIGALLVPIQVAALLYEPLLWEGPVEIIGMVLCGAIGIVTLVVLLGKLFNDSVNVTIHRPWLMLAGALIGALPLLWPLTSPIVAWRILAAMPIVAGAHLLFLGRRIFFPSAFKL